MKQQTAVEWLLEKIQLDHSKATGKLYENIQKAKQMEKGQIIDSYEQGVEDEIEGNRSEQFTNAEQYYNETYGK